MYQWVTGSKINRFLEIYNVPRLNQEMNRPIKNKDIGWIIK